MFFVGPSLFLSQRKEGGKRDEIVMKDLLCNTKFQQEYNIQVDDIIGSAERNTWQKYLFYLVSVSQQSSTF